MKYVIYNKRNKRYIAVGSMFAYTDKVLHARTFNNKWLAKDFIHFNGLYDEIAYSSSLSVVEVS